MNELEEYHQNLMADIRREADASGTFPVEAFFDRMTERLTEAGELEVADRAYYQSGEGGQKLRIDGYAGDPRDSEGVLGLIVCDFADSNNIETFGKSDVPPILNPLIRFLKKARTEEFRDALSEANPAFQVSDLIMTTWSQVAKVKLILVSNRQYIGRDDTVKLAALGDTPITWSVWDLARFERFDRSGQAREDMRVSDLLCNWCLVQRWSWIFDQFYAAQRSDFGFMSRSKPQSWFLSSIGFGWGQQAMG